MLHQPTVDTLPALHLTGMSPALCEHIALPESAALRCEERLGLLVDRESTARRARRLTTRLRPATWRQNAGLEDLEYRSPRGLDQALLPSLATGQWVRERRHVLSTGPTGVGKTWGACARGHPACRAGFPTRSLRLPRLLQERPMTTGDGRSPTLMTTLAKSARLLLDDWGLAALRDENRRDVLALLEDRHDRRATLGTSQLPVEHWHEALGDPTLADAILDRLVHNAYKLPLRGASLRKRQAKEPTHRGGRCDEG